MLCLQYAGYSGGPAPESHRVPLFSIAMEPEDVAILTDELQTVNDIYINYHKSLV